MQLRGLLLGALLVAGATAAHAFVQKDDLRRDTPEPVRTCPPQLGADFAAMRCTCPAEATAIGSVWGSDVYTDDSAICRAALHAGAISTDGGEVVVNEAPGQASYRSSIRNSVASTPFGAWRRSIVFRQVEAEVVQACPADARGLGVGTHLLCGCSAQAAASGNVWGSGPYTADSGICRAAVHAGAASGNGFEPVSVLITPGRGGYPASTRNGVASRSWPSYPTSFEFREPQ